MRQAGPLGHCGSVSRFVALLRAVNVGGRKLAMAELREVAERLGWSDVRTYIQSGNLLFEADGAADALEAELEAALATALGMDVPVLIRTASQWEQLRAANPLPHAADTEPQRLHLCLPKRPLAAAAEDTIAAKAIAGETVCAAGGALWIHYPAGVGTSRLTPALIDKAAGSPVTARNWRTVETLAGLLAKDGERRS